jgi:hypothetical protein
MIMLQPRQRSAIKGHTFGARGDSCSCDPCDCNPCKCGDGLQPNYPAWRVSGYFVRSGTFQQQQFSQQILLSLAQPEQAGSHEGWQEVLLVQRETPLELVNTLLSLFERDLASMPAEIGTYPQVQRAVYRAPLEYRITAQGPHLRVVFQPESIDMLYAGSGQQEVRPWTYDGPMALRGNFSRPAE